MRENSRMLQEVHATHGFVLVLVLLVQFPDHIDRNLPPVEEYEELFNGMEPSDIIPTGSIAKWLDDNSYGAFRIEAEVMDWVVTDMTEEEYSFNVSGVTLEFGRSMYPALAQRLCSRDRWGRLRVWGRGDNSHLVAWHFQSR